MTATAKENLLGQQWHHLSVREVARHLDSNLETGLTSAEAAKRQERFGPNELNRIATHRTVQRAKLV